MIPGRRCILFYCFFCFNLVIATVFYRAVFSLALVSKIILTQALVYFRDGVPACAVLLDAPLLHVEINEVFLLFADLAKVVQERPAVYIKGVLHVLQQRTFTSVRDMVINTRVASFGIRNTNGDFSSRCLVGTAETGGLTTASFISLDSMLPFLRRTGSVPLYEPLTQIGRHFDIDVIVAHKTCKMITSTKIL